jgi:glycosyltransferase involved in cell wall biosynthesis
VAVVAVVVVPARNEEGAIADCLAALARQTVGPDAFETVVVADACSDATASVASETAERLGLTLSVLTGPGAGSGSARRVGMDAAADRLEELGRVHGLITTTDADSAPVPDWLERQLRHLDLGAQVIAGLIELEGDEAARLPSAVLRRRELDAKQRLERLVAREPNAEHHHFAGASLGVSAAVYRQVGGLDPAPALEDAAFAVRLRDHGIPIVYAADVVVRTSARADGRARRGLSVDLAVSLWRERRRYRASDFSPEALADRKGTTTVSVIVPTRQCAGTIGGVLQRTIEPVRAAGLVDDVVVIDADSADDTASAAAACGATVLQQDAMMDDWGPALGKGDAMWRGLHATTGQLVCFLDGDTEDPHPHHLLGLLGPLLCEPGIELVKGTFARSLRTGAERLLHEGGRVTELTARPLLNLHVPLLAGFSQPLAGEFAARRELLEQLAFPVGYGVEIALLIDALRACGLDALAECDLGRRQNRHQPLRALGEMAFAVLAAVERRLDGPRSATGGDYLKPWEDGAIARVPISERPPLRSLVTDAA